MLAQGKVDLDDLKNAEVVHFHWRFIRNQMTDFQAELKDLRREIDSLQLKNKLLTDGKEQLGNSIEQLRSELTADHRHLSAEVEHVRREGQKRHAQLDEATQLALRNTEAAMRESLAKVVQEQRELRESRAERSSVEEAQASLRSEIMKVSKDDQSRYSQFSELVDLQMQGIQAQINQERAQLREANEEQAKKLEVALSDADSARRIDLARLSTEHHTRHDDLNSSLMDTSEELKRRISYEVGRCFDAHSKDYDGLRARLDISIKDLDAKLALVEAVGEEELQRRISNDIGKCFKAHYEDYEGLRVRLDVSLKDLDAKLALVEAKGREAMLAQEALRPRAGRRSSC